MYDKATLQINGTKIEKFKTFSVSADIYTADSSFQMELSNPETVIKGGQLCDLSINDVKELTGLIDKPGRKWTKDETHFTIEGRSLMGLLVDSYCTQAEDLQNTKIKTLANTLLKNVPFINTKNIVYEQDVAGRLKGKPKMGVFASAENAYLYSKIEPGMTIFDVLKQYATSRGLMFYGLPDGTFVFGTLKAQGDPVYTLILRKDGKNNNVIEVEYSEDYSKRYSDIYILAEQQGTTDIWGNACNPHDSVTDSTFPYKKPFVGRNNYGDAMSCKKYAGMILDKQKHDSFNVTYKVHGFSQNGKNWAINEIVHIDDEVNGLNGSYLIHGRTFERSKAGSFTTLRIGLLGGMY